MLALISVHDKAGVREFARSLAELGFEIYSTGGTQKHLSDGGLAVQSVSTLTGFPEILDGRVKTLHPMVHGGILARRDRPEQMEELARSEIPPIDIVCVNLYPFVETVARPDVRLDDALENIDIGGPTMLRAAAKNYPFVLVLVDPSDYAQALDHLRADAVPLEFRRRLAEKAFQHVASYDTAIAQYLRSDEQGEESFPERMTVALDKALDLRYGENPHQRAALYREERVGQDGGGIWRLWPLVALTLAGFLVSACGSGGDVTAPRSFPVEAAEGPSSASLPPVTSTAARIAFVSLRNNRAEINVVYADGSGFLNLSDRFAPNNSYPAWSPDGSQIAFVSASDGNAEIYVMSADGSGRTRLTDSPASDGFPAWSPDGNWIAFGSLRDGNPNFDIYIMRADGSDVRRLTTDPAKDSYPGWTR